MILLHPDSGIPMYEQIYSDIRDQILSGILPAGSRLPATRTLAGDYRISRYTVTAAYSQLLSEGYIRSVTGSGYYVEELPERTRHSAGSASCSDRQSKVTAASAEQTLKQYPFHYGDLNMNIYRSRAFRRCLRDAVSKLEHCEVLSYQDPQGNAALRKALSDFLNLSRSVKASADQIVITGGIQQALRTLTDIFPKTRYSAAFEDPGYSGASDVFRRSGYRMHYIPLDENGLNTAYLEKLHHTLLYVTPSHQFPMGSVLPIRRRLQLLRWADETDSYIIEDDYDSELRYHERPVPSLQSLGSNRVIYLGTFSKSLSPDFCASYMVLPEQIHISYGSAYSYFGTSVPALEQTAFAEYLSSGEYQKHLNRMRTVMRKRHDLIVRTLTDAFPEQVKLYGTGGGVHLVIQISTHLSQKDILHAFEAEGVFVMSLYPFWSDPELCPENQVLVGYGAVPIEKEPEYLAAMTHAIQKML